MKILLTLLACACVTSAAAAQTAPLTLERITADPPLAGRLPRQAEVSPGGQWVSFLRPSQADSEVLELWAQPAAGGEPRKLVAAADLLGGAAQQLSEAEKMALERQRISQRGITGYQWCGSDDSALLFPLSGDLYVVHLTAAGPQARKLALAAGAPKLEPRCAPDGKSLAFVQSGNLYVLPLAGGARPRQLTSDGSETVSWGLAEFIAAEELSRQRGYWWSKDGRSLLALRVDESGVALKTRAQIFADRTAMTQQRYPAAGEANAKVGAFVVDAASGRQRALPLPADAEYIARAGWFADGMPWLQWFTRDQRRLTLTEFKPATGMARDIAVETDPAWVEVHDDLIETPRGLLWSSEASGRRQLLLIDRASGTRTPLTQMPEAVAHAVCANSQSVVFTAAGDRGKSQELYSVPLTGGAAQMLPGAAPHQWRDAKADSACGRLLVTRSAWGQPPQLALRSLGQDGAIALAGDAPDPQLRLYANVPVALDLTAADGRTPLNAFFFAPQGRQVPAQGKHPVIVLAYGGPGAATVNWGWGRDMPLIAYWQQRGYGVLSLDTRGMQHRDRDFTRAHHRAFGQVEVDDLFAAVRQLPARLPGVDAARIGFFGWSYGGYLGARAVLDADTPFAAAVAVAPVTDWTLYDTAYTERYLGVPEGGKAATYASANLPARAALLAKPLLLVHGTADDNVLFEHTLRLVEALQNAGKTFDLQIYPGKAHGIAGRAARLHLYRTMDAFFERHLKPAP